jgi:hypothetical protein
MNWVILIFAVVAALVAVGLWWGYSRAGRELEAMRATKTSNARDVAAMAPDTAVELKGKLRTSAPLTAEFSGRQCVYYRALTEREVERLETNSDGKRESRREFEVESDVTKYAPAMFEDATGQVAIDFDGAKVEGEQVHRQRESAGLGTSLIATIAGAGTLGHRYTEWIVEAGVPVYVLASVTAGKTVGKAQYKKNPFIISIKSEEEREKALGRSRMWFLVGAVVLALVAVGLLYLAFTSGPVQSAT